MLANIKKIIKNLKAQNSPASAYKVIALPVGKHDYKFIVNVEKASVTPLTKHYLVEEPREMFNLVGKKIAHKRSFDGYATLDISALASSTRESIRKFGEAVPQYEIFIGEYNSEIVAGVYDKEFGDYIKIKTESQYNTIPLYAAIDTAGHTKEGWSRFANFKVFGASKGRKNVFDMFEQDSDFEKYINDATYGEYEKVKGMCLTPKELADAVTRLGAKSCPMGSENILVENILIILDKDNNLDGTGLLSYFKEVPEGLLIQCRPYTAKSTVFSVLPEFMEKVLARFNIVRLDKNNLTPEQDKLLDITLNKSDRRKSGMSNKDLIAAFGGNAIALIGNPNKGIQVVGDLNFWKDKWVYSRMSGLNVLDIASYKDKEFGAATSGQFNKLMLGAKIKAKKKTADKIDKFYKKIINREVNSKLSYDGKGSFDGTEYLNMDYLAGTYSILPIHSWVNEPSIFESVLEEKMKSLKDVFVRDRYHVPGHSAMCMADLAYWLTGEKILDVKVDDKGNVLSFESFDPAANRYIKETGADNSGYVVKYPSMGTREGCFTDFISLELLTKRINDNDIFTDEEKKLLIEAYTSIAEGTVVCPASLHTLAMILAGFDLDGDHFEVYFSTPDGLSIPLLLKEAGFIPVAVDIEAGNDENTDERVFDLKQWAVYSAMLIANNNKSVGTVTNTFRLFTDGLLADLKNDKDRLKFYKELFLAIGGTEGGRDYESVIECGKNENGVIVYKGSNESVKKFLGEALIDVNYDNPDNIVKILKDMDILGRVCQELTIDAQKKFYNVFCKWMEDTKGYSLFCLKTGFEFKIVRDNKGQRVHWEFVGGEGYRLNPDTGFVEVPSTVAIIPGDYYDTYAVADASTRYRVFAANAVIKRLPNIFEAYNEAYNKWENNEPNRAKRATALADSFDRVGFGSIELLIKAIGTIDKARLDYTRKMKDNYFEVNAVPEKIAEKVYADIRKTANLEYTEALDSISNEIRRIAKTYSMDIEKLAEYINLSGIDTSMKILKPERFLQKIKAICPIIDIPTTHFFEEDVYEVSSKNGLLFAYYPNKMKTYSHTDLFEGDYEVNRVNGKLSLTTGIEKFISIPETDVNDNKRVVIGYRDIPEQFDMELIRKRADKAFRIDRKVKITAIDGKFYLQDTDINECFAGVNFGGRSGRAYGKEIAKDYNKFKGTITSKVISVNDNDRIINYMVVLEK